ncbi:MAG: YbjQ family protein [Chlorobiota bacterium]
MHMSNTPTVPGFEIVETHGLVRGNIVKTKHIGRDFMAGIRNIVGGEVGSYTQMLTEAREQVLDRMCNDARQMGANAIVNVRFATSAIGQGMAELLVYGTAVKVEKK